MTRFLLTAAIAPFCLIAPAMAETAPQADQTDQARTAPGAAPAKDADTVTTGVA